MKPGTPCASPALPTVAGEPHHADVAPDPVFRQKGENIKRTTKDQIKDNKDKAIEDKKKNEVGKENKTMQDLSFFAH